MCVLSVQVDQRVFKDLMSEKLPRLHAHFEQYKVDFSLITFNWFLVVFVDSVVSDILFKIWDAFLYEGPKVRAKGLTLCPFLLMCTGHKLGCIVQLQARVNQDKTWQPENSERELLWCVGWWLSALQTAPFAYNRSCVYHFPAQIIFRFALALFKYKEEEFLKLQESTAIFKYLRCFTRTVLDSRYSNCTLFRGHLTIWSRFKRSSTRTFIADAPLRHSCTEQ